MTATRHDGKCSAIRIKPHSDRSASPNSTHSLRRGGYFDLIALEDLASLIKYLKAGKKTLLILNSVNTDKDFAKRLNLSVARQPLSNMPHFSRSLGVGLGVTQTDRNGSAARQITALCEELWARDVGGREKWALSDRDRVGD